MGDGLCGESIRKRGGNLVCVGRHGHFGRHYFEFQPFEKPTGPWYRREWLTSLYELVISWGVALALLFGVLMGFYWAVDNGWFTGDGRECVDVPGTAPLNC